MHCTNVHTCTYYSNMCLVVHAPVCIHHVRWWLSNSHIINQKQKNRKVSVTCCHQVVLNPHYTFLVVCSQGNIWPTAINFLMVTYFAHLQDPFSNHLLLRDGCLDSIRRFWPESKLHTLLQIFYQDKQGSPRWSTYNKTFKRNQDLEAHWTKTDHSDVKQERITNTVFVNVMEEKRKTTPKVVWMHGCRKTAVLKQRTTSDTSSTWTQSWKQAAVRKRCKHQNHNDTHTFCQTAPSLERHTPKFQPQTTTLQILRMQ